MTLTDIALISLSVFSIIVIAAYVDRWLHNRHLRRMRGPANEHQRQPLPMTGSKVPPAEDYNAENHPSLKTINEQLAARDKDRIHRDNVNGYFLDSLNAAAERLMNAKNNRLWQCKECGRSWNKSRHLFCPACEFDKGGSTPVRDIEVKPRDVKPRSPIPPRGAHGFPDLDQR
jgi:hypothetical protein